MPEYAKTRLQQSRISKFSGGGPPDPLYKGRGGKEKGGEEREGKGKGRREGKDRDGKGQGREGGRGGMGGGGKGGKGRGGALDMGSPLETSSGSAPELMLTVVHCILFYFIVFYYRTSVQHRCPVL